MATKTGDRKNVLTISLANYLHGTFIQPGLHSEWVSKTSSETRARFNNVGFDVDPASFQVPLRNTLRDQGPWDGVLIGWCSRGYPERTELFEEITNICVDEVGGKAKLMFCTGPTNVVEATLRNFPS